MTGRKLLAVVGAHALRYNITDGYVLRLVPRVLVAFP
jgi:hypothetical protein